MKLAFIGIGVMGGPMAGHLAKAGHSVTVYNRSRAKVQGWAAQYQGTAACSSCATARAQGLHFLDAPVSGGQSGAEQGILTVMVGGDEEPYARAEPVIRHFARAVTLMGPAGSGQKTKMVNQICVAGVIQGLAEGLAFALHAGLDARRAVDVISKGAATSWQMENRGKTMVDDKFDFGFALDWMRKDLRICAETARATGADLTVTNMIDGFYAEIQKMGGGRWDTSSLIRRIRKV